MRQRVSISNKEIDDIPIGGDAHGVGATCYSRVKTGPDEGLFIVPLEVAKQMAEEPHESWGEVKLVGEPDDKDTIVKG